MYKNFIKRVIDFILVFVVLAVIWPIVLLIILLTKELGRFFSRSVLVKMVKFLRSSNSNL